MAYAPLERHARAAARSGSATTRSKPGRALGDRLWMLVFPGNVWFPAELVEAIRRDVPDAHVEEVENGAVSRPDLTAEIVRRITHC